MLPSLIRRFLSLAGLSAVAVSMAAAQATTPSPTARPKPAAPQARLEPARLDAAAQKDQFSKNLRHALLVAPDYQNKGPRSGLADMKLLQKELEHHGYGVRLMVPANATAEAVRQALRDKKVEFEGNVGVTFIFAFAGQGFRGADGRNYLITTGVDPTAMTTIVRQALPLAEVQALINATGAAKKVVLLDGSRDGKTYGELREVPGLAQLIAARPGGSSHEDPASGRGIFFDAVSRGFAGKAAGPDGFLTFFDLKKYVDGEVMAAAMKLDRSQRPLALGVADLLVGIAPPRVEEPVKLSIVLPPAPPPEPAPGPQPISELPPPPPPPPPDVNRLKKADSTETFRARLNGTILTLVNEKTQVQLVQALAKNVKIDDGHLRFEGKGILNQLFHLVAKVKDGNVESVQGRIGVPCPDAQICADDVPMLPGEDPTVFKKLQRYAEFSKKLTGTAARIKLFRERAQRALDQFKQTAGITAEVAKAFDELLAHKWQTFDLANSISVGGQTAVARN